MENNIPNGWVKTSLGEIAEWGSGGTPSRAISKYFIGNIPWIKTGELNDNVIYETEEHISEEALKNSSAKIFPKGSVAIAMYGATIGKTAILGIDAATNQACAIAKTFPGINNKYLYYYLKSEKQNFIDKGKGGAQPNISQTVIKLHPFPLAPANEQKRIADKLDCVFDHVNILKEKLNDIPNIIERFKQCVISNALKGLLTGTIEFDEKELRDVITLEYGKSLPSSKRTGDGFPVYGSNGIIGFHDQYLVHGPGIVVGRKGSNGEVTWATNNFFPIDTAYFVKLKTECNLKFIFYLLQTLDLKKYNRSSAIPGLNREDVYKLCVQIPSLPAQEKIVEKIELLFDMATKINSQYNILKEKVDMLPQSTLRKAFKGLLIKQNRTDEPAIKLLNRIRVERSKLS
jgi:type I restriction enzyme, S subunit